MATSFPKKRSRSEAVLAKGALEMEERRRLGDEDSTDDDQASEDGLTQSSQNLTKVPIKKLKSQPKASQEEEQKSNEKESKTPSIGSTCSSSSTTSSSFGFSQPLSNMSPAWKEGDRVDVYAEWAKHWLLATILKPPFAGPDHEIKIRVKYDQFSADLQEEYTVAWPCVAAAHAHSSMLDNWRKTLHAGVQVDCLDSNRAWLIATVVEVKSHTALIAYDHWDECWNEWIPLHSLRLFPRNHFTTKFGAPSRISQWQWMSFEVLLSSKGSPLAAKSDKTIDVSSSHVLSTTTIPRLSNLSSLSLPCSTTAPPLICGDELRSETMIPSWMETMIPSWMESSLDVPTRESIRKMKRKMEEELKDIEQRYTKKINEKIEEIHKESLLGRLRNEYDKLVASISGPVSLFGKKKFYFMASKGNENSSSYLNWSENTSFSSHMWPTEINDHPNLELYQDVVLLEDHRESLVQAFYPESKLTENAMAVKITLKDLLCYFFHRNLAREWQMTLQTMIDCNFITHIDPHEEGSIPPMLLHLLKERISVISHHGYMMFSDHVEENKKKWKWMKQRSSLITYSSSNAFTP